MFQESWKNIPGSYRLDSIRLIIIDLEMEERFGAHGLLDVLARTTGYATDIARRMEKSAKQWADVAVKHAVEDPRLPLKMREGKLHEEESNLYDQLDEMLGKHFPGQHRNRNTSTFAWAISGLPRAERPEAQRILRSISMVERLEQEMDIGLESWIPREKKKVVSMLLSAMRDHRVVSVYDLPAEVSNAIYDTVLADAKSL
jgi:hypothetical protein